MGNSPRKQCCPWVGCCWGSGTSASSHQAVPEISSGTTGSRTNPPSQGKTSSSSNTTITNLVQQLQAYPTDVTKFEAILKFIDEALAKCQDHSKSDTEVSRLIQGHLEDAATTLNGIYGLCQEKDGTQVKLELQKMLSDVVGALGSVHWIMAAFSMVAFVLNRIDKTRENKQSCLGLLDKVRVLGHHLLKLFQRIPNESQKFWNAGFVIVEVAIFCIEQLDAGYWRRFAFVKVTTGDISKFNELINGIYNDLNLTLTIHIFDNQVLDTVKSNEDTPLPEPARSSYFVPAIVGTIGVLVTLTVGIVWWISGYSAREDGSGQYKSERARVYSVKELSIATKNFSSVLGEGGFGTVYRADFPDGTVAAVKVEKPRGLTPSSKVLASDEIPDEIALLLRVHHRNLVNLIGFGIDKGTHMLVFEYLPNGSLHDRLHQSTVPSLPRSTSQDAMEMSRLRCSVIPWSQRVKIAADVACGLQYLHHEADPPIVHRDIKSKNILLTTTDSAKLADFGLSKAAPANATTFQPIETMVRGSIGYMDPQYSATGVFSTKSDVYSFGVVLLELISGHPAVYNAAPLASWAAPYITDPSFYHGLVDKRLNGDFQADELASLVELSKMCMQEDGKMRPSMREVVTFIPNSHLQSGRC